MKNVNINTEYIKLNQFLKWIGVAESGSHATFLIKEEQISLNETIITQRGKKLYPGDIIKISGVGSFKIEGRN